MLNPWYLFTISFSWPWIQFGYSAFHIHSGACVEKHYPFHIIDRTELNSRNPLFPLYPTGFWLKFPNRRAFENNANRFRIQTIHNFTTTITSFFWKKANLHRRSGRFLRSRRKSQESARLKRTKIGRASHCQRITTNDTHMRPRSDSKCSPHRKSRRLIARNTQWSGRQGRTGWVTPGWIKPSSRAISPCKIEMKH